MVESFVIVIGGFSTISSPVPSSASTDTDISSLVRQPQSKFMRRLPVALYRLGFGPLLGIMPFLILTTRTQNGAALYTPLEYRRHGSRIYVLATGRDARWLRRVHDDGVVTVRIGWRAFPAAAHVVTDEGEAVRALFQFRMNAPVPLRWIYWSGRNRSITHPQNFRDASRRYTFVRLDELNGKALGVPAVPADRVWMSVLAAAVFAALCLMVARNGKR